MKQQNRKLCCIGWCRNNSSKTRSAGVRYYSIPKSDSYGKKWREWILNENSVSSNSLKLPLLCNEHFSKNYILPNGRLAAGAVPAIGKTSGLRDCEEHKTSTSTQELTAMEFPTNSCIAESTVAIEKTRSPKCSEENSIQIEKDLLGFECEADKPSSSPNESKAAALPHSSAVDTVPSTLKAVTLVKPVAPPQEERPEEKWETLKTGTNKKNNGDLFPVDLSSPFEAAKFFRLARVTSALFKRKMKVEQSKRLRLETKLKSLESRIEDLKENERRLLTERDTLKLQLI